MYAIKVCIRFFWCYTVETDVGKRERKGFDSLSTN